MIAILSFNIATIALLVSILTGKTIAQAVGIAFLTTIAFYLAVTERRKTKAEIIPIGIVFVLIAGTAGFLPL